MARTVTLGDHGWARAGRVLPVALLTVAVACWPAAAFAAFSGTGTGALTAATATLAAPSPLNLSTTCPHGRFDGSLTVTFANVARATGYTITLVPPSSPTQQATVTSGSAGASFTLLDRKGTYTLTVVSQVARWSSAPGSASVSC